MPPVGQRSRRRPPVPAPASWTDTLSCKQKVTTDMRTDVHKRVSGLKILAEEGEFRSVIELGIERQCALTSVSAKDHLERRPQSTNSNGRARAANIEARQRDAETAGTWQWRCQPSDPRQYRKFNRLEHHLTPSNARAPQKPHRRFMADEIPRAQPPSAHASLITLRKSAA